MNNPMQLLSMLQMMQQDPRVGQAMQMIQGKSPQELRQMAENLAKERGIDLNAFMQQFGVR